MAKKKNVDTDTSKKQTLARITRTERYAEQIRLLFAQAVNEILALNKQIPTLGEGEMFSFDAQSQKMQEKVQNVLRQLHSAATAAIKQGVRLEWEQANAEVDKLLSSVMGKRIMSDTRFNALTGRNTAALNAFLDRSERGMNLSERVWKPVRQLRDEMEVALTISIGEGESAANMSRKVRQYLNDPDLMFRRFRYKKAEEIIYDENGEEIGRKPIYGLKWKKRVRGSDGKIHFIDYDKDSYKDEYTGKGYYKSSAQNAMRVTRTETNIAYRRADHARWQDLDFVLGVRVQVSKSHKHSKDGHSEICEKLQGDYPKDFIFDGWHPQCFCFATPIMMDESEMQKYADALAEGKKYTPKGKRITDYPQGFKDWVQENSEKLIDAHDYGRDPYFCRNNYGVIDKIIKGESFDDPVRKDPLEIAKERHENRTPEQEQEIRNRAAQRQKAIETAERYTKEFEDLPDIDTSALQDAASHARWDEVRQEAAKLALKKREILNEARTIANELKKIKDIDTDPIEAALSAGKLSEISSQSKDLNDQKQKILSLSQLEDPIAVAEKFSLAEAQAVNAAIEKTFARWTWNFDTDASLQFLKGKLENEILVAERSKSKYSTWEISKAAYEKRLALVNKRIDMKSVKDSIQTQIAEIKSSRSALAKTLVSEFDALFADNDTSLSVLRAKALDIKTKGDDLLKKRLAREAKKAGSSSSPAASPVGVKSDAELKKDFEDFMRKIGSPTSASAIDIDNGVIKLDTSIQKKIYGSVNITPKEERQTWAHSAGGYIQTGHSFSLNGALRDMGGKGKNKIIGDIRKADLSKSSDMYGQKLSSDDVVTIETMDSVIGRNSLPFPILLIRNVTQVAADSMFGVDFSKIAGSNLAEKIKTLGMKQLVPDPAYMSTSINARDNVFKSRKIQFQIEIPANFPLYVTKNYMESECVLGRMTKLAFISVQQNGDYTIIRVRAMK